jgi:hypothetical protein
MNILRICVKDKRNMPKSGVLLRDGIPVIIVPIVEGVDFLNMNFALSVKNVIGIPQPINMIMANQWFDLYKNE